MVDDLNSWWPVWLMTYMVNDSRWLKDPQGLALDLRWLGPSKLDLSVRHVSTTSSTTHTTSSTIQATAACGAWTSGYQLINDTSTTTTWVKGRQLSTICNRCSQFGDNHTGCHLDQRLPRSRWWVLRVRPYGPEDSMWNLLAYSGLWEFSIWEESSSRETRLDWTQLGEVSQV